MRFSWLCLLVVLAVPAGAQHYRLPGKTINEQERIKALELLQSADTLQQSVYWPHITPARFIANVKQNILQPLRLNNGRTTNFCAYGALSYTCLKNEPLRYTACMIDLYRNGQAMYRNVHLAPSEAIRNTAGTIIFQGEFDIHPADQVWFLSLAHRFKGYLNMFNRRYQPGDENTMWAATNLAKFNRMLRKLCRYKTSSRGSDLLRPSIKDLPRYLQEKMASGEVYLYLNNSVLRKKSHNRMRRRIPTHYVVLLSLEPKGNDMLTITYWDGDYKTIKEVTPASLKRIIYGISWVKYNEENNE